MERYTTVKLPLMAYYLNILKRSDLDGFCKTFTEGIYISENKYNSFISKRKVRLLDPNKIKTAFRRPRVGNLAHWMILAPHNRDIMVAIKSAVKNRDDLFPKGWFSVSSARIGYAVMLLINNLDSRKSALIKI